MGLRDIFAVADGVVIVIVICTERWCSLVLLVARLTESDWHDQPALSYPSIEEAKYLFKKGIRKMKELREDIEFEDK